MGQLSDFLAQPVPPALIKRPPKGWESGVEERDGRIVVTTDPLPSEPDETVWKELVADWGIDPERYEILPGSMQFRGWDAAVGGGQVRRLRYYRATLVERTPAAMRADVDELIAAAAKRKPPRRLYTGTGPPVLLSANDWQLGKLEGGGTPATLDHLLGSFTAFRDHRKMLDRTKRRPAEVVIANTGDLTERMFGHYPSQMSTVDLNEREQQRVARRLLMRLVDDAVDDGYPVLMTAVPCNHGENRGNTSKGMKAISTPDDNVSLMLVEAIEEACAANPDRYGAVRFAYAPNHVLAVPIDGINVAMTHGHQVGSKREKGATSATGAAAMESWWRGQVMDRDNPMAHADILLTAHRHHLQISEESGRPIFLAPASDGGSYWYTSTTGRFSTRGVLSLTIGESHPRGWGDLVIL